MTMCAEGDVAGIVELLKAIEEDHNDDDMLPAQLIRYQDPLDGMMTGLHVAVEKNQQEVLCLLLWLASDIPTSAFAQEIIQLTETMGAARYPDPGCDIRKLQDEQERTAEDIANKIPNWANTLAGRIMRA
jgi:hypothetical protein